MAVHVRLVPHSGGRISTAGGTGEAPVCCAKWWDERREMASPVMMALPKTNTPMATSPAIRTISIWIAMETARALPLLSGKHMGTERPERQPYRKRLRHYPSGRSRVSIAMLL
jgi:hypothetical protein